MLDWNTAKNILCIRLDTIGDVIMTAPAMQVLKASHPERHITLMTSAAGAGIAPLIPAIDDVILYDAPWLKATAPRITNTPEFAMIEHLRQAQFDAAVIFTVYSQNPLPSAFLCYMAGIPLRLAHCHENPYQLLTHWIKDLEPEQYIRHEVRRQLDLVASVGCFAEEDFLNENFLNGNSLNENRLSGNGLEEKGLAKRGLEEKDQRKMLGDRPLLHVPPEILQQIQTRLLEFGIYPHQPWIVIHPGASAPSRRYPPEQFATVAQTLIQDANIPVIFTGTQPEYELVESIRSMMNAPSYSLVNCLNLQEFAALLTLTPLLISNNTGPVHIASAVGTSVVDLYALTNLQHMPWNVPHRVLFHEVPCKLCYKSICPEGHHHCLRLVEPNTVVNAALDLLRLKDLKSTLLYEKIN